MSEAAASTSTMHSAASALRSSSSAYQCAASANQCAIEAAQSAHRAAQAAEIAEAAAEIAQSHAQSHAHSSGLRCRVQVRIGNKRLTYSQHHESEAQAAEHAYIQFDGYAKDRRHSDLCLESFDYALHAFIEIEEEAGTDREPDSLTQQYCRLILSDAGRELREMVFAHVAKRESRGA